MSTDRVWTVLDLLRWTQEHFEARQIDTPRLDAECLLAAALGMDRLGLYLEFDKPVQTEERAQFRELVRRRADERVPVAYLTGTKEFWSLSLRVTPAVLIPRGDTEVLVSQALAFVPDRDTALEVLDLGTGSGAIALAIASERSKALITATDRSAAALEIARANAEALELSAQICFLEGDLFSPVRGRRFDLILANLPYVPETVREHLAPELAHEPAEALFAGGDGLDVLRGFVREVPDGLRPGGAVVLEMGPEQAEPVAQWLRDASLVDVQIHDDLAGRPRALSARARDTGADGSQENGLD